MVTVVVPDTRANYHSFSALLAELPQTDNVDFDFGRVGFATPAWMITVGSTLRQFRVDRPDVKRRAVNYHHLTYAAHAGFFKFFGLPFGNAPDTAKPNERFLPITVVSADSIRDEATESMQHHGDVIQHSSEKVVEVLLQSREVAAFEALSYAIREIIRNVIEHSASEDLAYAAQYWPTKGIAEVAITDRGVGLARSLSSNPKIGTVDDQQAVDLATRPGVSSKTWRRPRSNSVWNNSGFGLYMVKGLCVATGGMFSISSGSVAGKWNGTEFVQHDANVKGTTVCFTLDSNSLSDLDSQLEQLRKDAHAIKTKRQPSPASMSLKPGRGEE